MTTTITHDADCPSEIIALMSAFEGCAADHRIDHVFEASFNMLVSAINHLAVSQGGGREHAVTIARRLGPLIEHNVALQWDREPDASDIVARGAH